MHTSFIYSPVLPFEVEKEESQQGHVRFFQYAYISFSAAQHEICASLAALHVISEPYTCEK